MGEYLPDPPVGVAKAVGVVKWQMPKQVNILVAAVPRVQHGATGNHSPPVGLAAYHFIILGWLDNLRTDAGQNRSVWTSSLLADATSTSIGRAISSP